MVNDPKTFMTFCLKHPVALFLQILLQVLLVMWNKSKPASTHLITTERDDDENDELLKLVTAQRNAESLIKTVTITGEHYLVFAYAEKQIQDIEKFCTTELEAWVVAVNTTLRVDMWITNTLYRNKHLLNPTTENTSSIPRSSMLCFSKN